MGQKSFRHRGFLERLKRPWLGSPAHREWNNARRLAEAGVPVPEPLSFENGAGTDGEDRYLFRWLADHVDLQEAILSDQLDARARRRIASRLGRIVRAMHDSGWIHRDLHAANVLVGPAQEVVLADFHRARRSAHDHARRRDLLELGHFFRHRAHPTEMLRFLKAYHEPDATQERSQRHARLRSLDQDAHGSLLRFLCHHEQRFLAPGRHAESVTAWDMQGLADPRHRTTWQAVLGLMDLPWDATPTTQTPRDASQRASATVTLLHAGGRGKVYRVAHEETTWIAKVFEEPGVVGLLKATFRGSLARRAWLALHRLRMAGIRTPIPYLFVQQAVLSGSRRSILVMSDEPGEHLGTYLGREESPGRPETLDVLATQVARAHDHGLRNRDLKAENLLVDEERRHVIWLDPDGVRRVGRIDSDTVARDLMRLNASFPENTGVRRTTRLRFLRRYRKRRRSPVEGLSSLWRHIHHLTLAKWNRNQPR